MIDLNKEAKEYAKRFEEREDFGYNGESISIEDRIEMEAFIAGANSKHVQAKALQAKIDALSMYSLNPTILGHIEKLQQQLKQLEDAEN
jgi:hypothetical protein